MRPNLQKEQQSSWIIFAIGAVVALLLWWWLSLDDGLSEQYDKAQRDYQRRIGSQDMRMFVGEQQLANQDLAARIAADVFAYSQYTRAQKRAQADDERLDDNDEAEVIYVNE